MKSLLKKRRGWTDGAGSKNRGVGFLFALLATTIFTVFPTFRSTAQASVYAGEDWSICAGDQLTLSDLNATLTNISGDAWWETSGDGTFQNSIMFNDAVSYTPGSNDLLNGEVILTLYGREFNPNGPIYSDQVRIVMPDFVYLACNDHINFSLDKYCEFAVKVDMLLEGEHPPLNLYTLKIWDEAGQLVPNNILTGEHLDQLLTYSIGNQCDLNSCGGTINVRDLYPPVLYCETDTITCLDYLEPDSLGFPLDTSVIDTIYYLDNNTYYLKGWDACTDATLHYQDQYFPYNCDSAFQELIIRTWTAEDMNGNVSTCHDSIKVERVRIQDLQLPPSYNNIDSAALECNGNWIALPNGNPSPESTGSPVTRRCSDIVYQYTDTRFEGCGSTFDVYRDWTIMDWCTQELIHWGQIIKVMDTTPPVMTCEVENMTIGSDLYNCYSETHQLVVPEVYDDCATFEFEVSVRLFGDPTDLAPVSVFDGNYFVNHLPLGTHTVVFKAMDACDNESQCSYELTVIDDVLPYAICDEHTQVSLGSNGIARMHAISLDDGSYDNCGIESFEVMKMTDACGLGQDTIWAPYLDFCCAEVGDTIMVSMRVTDVHGNQNICMVEVLVEDKYYPAIVCPPDITISCDFYYNPNDLDSYFGKVVTDPADREDIIINDYFNSGVVGQDGVAYDNCNVQVDTTVEFDLNECNVGKIYRTFTAVDDGGLKQPCLQTITIEDPDPFDVTDIIWPDDVEMNGCLALDTDTTETGSPIIDDDACSLVAVSFEDQVFTIVDDACEKVVRTWTVIDWCQFDHNTQEGLWTYKQVIKLHNHVAPEFTSSCEDRELCIYGYCDGLIELEATAEDDCTPQEDLVFVWRLDENGDGVFEATGQGNYFARVLEEGTYTIHWTVEDLCGNQTDCSYDFTVKDCKLPTPYCISSLTTVVMNNSGMVSITPEAYDVGSYDNCTAQEDLLLSWSPDVNDTIYTITCDSMGGFPEKTFFLDMWVTDEAGNQDYCSIWLQVQDNFNVCDPDQGSGLVIGGAVYLAETNLAMANMPIELECSLSEYSGLLTTNQNGSYIFDQLPAGYDYTLEPAPESACIEGVSTLDLVFIQRHILGLELLDSPYKMIAADANNTNSISAADILEIRKLVLGVNQEYPNSDCWKSIRKSHTFDNPYAPWDYESSYTFNNMSQDQLNKDFYLIKTGDVNRSYTPLQADPPLDTRTTTGLVIEDRYLQKDQVDLIPVYADDFDYLMGLQFTLSTIPELEILDLASGSLNIKPENRMLNSGDLQSMTFSWNTLENATIDEDEPLFFVQLKANKAIKISDALRMGSEITKAVLVRDLEEAPLSLSFRSDENNLFSYKLEQNEPNPFDGKTTVRFEIPVDQQITLTVFDTDGKVVKEYNNWMQKGKHEIIVTNEDLQANGIYYYTLETKGFVDTRKMIYLR